MPIPLIPAIIGGIIESAVDDAAMAPNVPAAPVGPLAGQLRTLPAESRVGMMAPPAVGAVQIDGQVFGLAPGAQIRNELNMIVVPTAVEQPVLVRYLVDAMGYVSRVWILTPAELAASR